MDVRRSSALIPSAEVELAADLLVPAEAAGVVLFAHGSGSSRHSPRNVAVAHLLNQHALATVLVDLLTETEERVDVQTAELRFDIGLLTDRLVGLVDWIRQEPTLRELPLGVFGASTGAAGALTAAAARPAEVTAVVSRGGRPDLAGEALARVQAPTLMLVGEWDEQVRQLNAEARARMTAPSELVVVPGATHLFEEPGTLDEVARATAAWFTERFAAARTVRAGTPVR